MRLLTEILDKQNSSTRRREHIRGKNMARVIYQETTCQLPHFTLFSGFGSWDTCAGAFFCSFNWLHRTRGHRSHQLLRQPRQSRLDVIRRRCSADFSYPRLGGMESSQVFLLCFSWFRLVYDWLGSRARLDESGSVFFFLHRIRRLLTHVWILNKLEGFRIVA